MTNFNRLLIVVFLMTTLTLITSFDVKANASASKKKAKTTEIISAVEMKCHVEFLGGGESIHFINTTRYSPSQLRQRLVGEKISTSMEKAAQEIYKVKECTKFEKDFRTEKAKSLDENTVR